MPHDESTVTALSPGLRVSLVSIVWTVAASSVAIGAGLAASDLVLVAFGVTGCLDAMGSIALVIHFRHALLHEPFSARHERVAFLVVSGGLVIVGVATIPDAIHRLLAATRGHSTILGICAALASAVVLTMLSRLKIRLGRSIPSQALVADGLFSAAGAVLAVVTVIGASLSSLGAWWTDPVAALGVAGGAMGVALMLARNQPTI